MSVNVIATACAALIEEETGAKTARAALEKIVEVSLSDLKTLDIKHAHIITEWLLAVGLKYKNSGKTQYWNDNRDYRAHAPKFVSLAHKVWLKHIKGNPQSTNEEHLERLFSFTLRSGSVVLDEAHVFLCDVLQDDLDQRKYHITPPVKIDVWKNVGDLGAISSDHQQRYQNLYSDYFRSQPQTFDWTTLGRIYFFPQVLDILLDERDTLLNPILQSIAQNKYGTSLSCKELSQRLIAHAHRTNQDIVELLNEHHSSRSVVETFKDSGLDLTTRNKQVWNIQQLHCLHNLSNKFSTHMMLRIWEESSIQTRHHALTLALISQMKPCNIKTRFSVMADTSEQRANLVEKCLADMRTLKDHPLENDPLAYNSILKKFENGSLWNLMPQQSHRAVFDAISENAMVALQTPINDKGFRVLTAMDIRALGSHIHVMYRSLHNNDGLVAYEDAALAKKILLERPQINTKTQLLNMVKLVEGKYIEVSAEEIDLLQEKLKNNSPAELLLLASTSVRPQAAAPTKRKL